MFQVSLFIWILNYDLNSNLILLSFYSNHHQHEQQQPELGDQIDKKQLAIDLVQSTEILMS